MFKGLNKAQKTALLKVLMCRDYVLIKGYPGTGARVTPFHYTTSHCLFFMFSLCWASLLFLFMFVMFIDVNCWCVTAVCGCAQVRRRRS